MTEQEWIKRDKDLRLKFINDVLQGSKDLVLKRFDKEQDVDGKSKFNNAPLKESTIKERGSSNPILNRTGKLRKSIQFINDGKGKIDISSSIKYAEDLHQGRHSGFWGRHADGTPKKINAEMKPRKFLAFPEEFKTGKGIKKLYDKLNKDRATLFKQYLRSKER